MNENDKKRKTFGVSNEFFWYVYVKLTFAVHFLEISTLDCRLGNTKHRAVSLVQLTFFDCENRRVSADNWFCFCSLLNFGWDEHREINADDTTEILVKQAENHEARRLSIFIDFSHSISYRLLNASMRPSKTVNNNHVPTRRWRNWNSAWVSSRLIISDDGNGNTEIKWK